MSNRTKDKVILCPCCLSRNIHHYVPVLENSFFGDHYRCMSCDCRWKETERKSSVSLKQAIEEFHKWKDEYRNKYFGILPSPIMAWTIALKRYRVIR